jgi:hypothetical protein
LAVLAVLVVFLAFLALCDLCLCVGFGASEVAGAGSAAIGAADFGMSAAMEPAARPKTNNAAVIRDADLIIQSPKACKNYERRKDTRSLLLWSDMKIISRTNRRHHSLTRVASATSAAGGAL